MELGSSYVGLVLPGRIPLFVAPTCLVGRLSMWHRREAGGENMVPGVPRTLGRLYRSVNNTTVPDGSIPFLDDQYRRPYTQEQS